MNINEAKELTKSRIMEDTNDLLHNIFNNIITATENKFIETTYYFNRNISYIEVNDCCNYLQLEGK